MLKVKLNVKKETNVTLLENKVVVKIAPEIDRCARCNQ